MDVLTSITRTAVKRGMFTLVGVAAALALASGPAAATPTRTTATAATAAPAAAVAPAAVSRARIVRIAHGELGYHERPGNCTKYGPCEEWCSLFATWVWRHAGVNIPKYPFTGDVFRWGQRHHLAYGRAGLRGAKPGDVLLFGTGPQNTHTSTHIGIVEKVSANRRTVTLIEGNSSDRVREVSHPLSGNVFYGGVRP